VISETEVRELEAFLRRKKSVNGIRRYRVVVLSGDAAEVEVEAESAEAARAIVEAEWQTDWESFVDRNFVEADTWWSVEEAPPN
jgi:nitroimidazol reductase NimA-like FMN-containing flavoprotein (pyridoxamine 5'-phosphate oxidase superfamily)